MELLIISPSTGFPDETATATALFEAGLERFHLRKPDFSEMEMENYICQLPKEFLSKVVVHSAHQLQGKYNLGGIHFTKQNAISEEIKNKERSFSLSCSAHSFKEAEEKTDGTDYVFISPVFDSISKNGYKSGFGQFELNRFIKNYNLHSKGTNRAKIYALGGIDLSNIKSIKEMGFSGAAILGGIWNSGNKETIVEKFIKMRKES
ncbi:MAG: thiamine phosphate synthase [Bacteroidetes bacterium]|nr:thiamine phosphate synthase [Bacteroidota bacterium]